jgi:hypothetical protein
MDLTPRTETRPKTLFIINHLKLLFIEQQRNGWMDIFFSTGITIEFIVLGSQLGELAIHKTLHCAKALSHFLTAEEALDELILVQRARLLQEILELLLAFVLLARRSKVAAKALIRSPIKTTT